MQINVIKNAKKTSFLIGDSPIWGKDQVISDTLKYNKRGQYDSQNRSRILQAQKIAAEGRCDNIRIVTIHHNAICNSMGVIGYRESKRIIKPFKLD